MSWNMANWHSRVSSLCEHIQFLDTFLIQWLPFSFCICNQQIGLWVPGFKSLYKFLTGINNMDVLSTVIWLLVFDILTLYFDEVMHCCSFKNPCMHRSVCMHVCAHTHTYWGLCWYGFEQHSKTKPYFVC